MECPYCEYQLAGDNCECEQAFDIDILAPEEDAPCAPPVRRFASLRELAVDLVDFLDQAGGDQVRVFDAEELIALAQEIGVEAQLAADQAVAHHA